MATRQKTFGQFFDAVEKYAANIISAKIFIKEYNKMLSTEEWSKICAKPLTEQLVIRFTQNIAINYQDRITRIRTEELCEMILQEGHQFLQEIHRITKELGLELDINLIDPPLTLSEAIVRKIRSN